MQPILCFGANPVECQKVQISSLVFESNGFRHRISSEEVCRASGSTFFLSRNCYGSRCAIKNEIGAHALGLPRLQEQGSPAGRLCDLYNGHYQMIEFDWHQEHWRLGRCISAKDESFFSDDLLIQIQNLGPPSFLRGSP
jgi:hypothetical protein